MTEPNSPAAENIRTIANLQREAARQATRGERLGLTVSTAIGTLTFVIVQLICIAAWIGWNLASEPSSRFDPYPFGLLTLIISIEGVSIVAVVLMSQNRMARQGDERDHLNLQINLLTEQEITLVLKLLRQVAERLKVAPEITDEARATELTEETDVQQIVETLRKELPENAPDRE
jgi:uncharacterized membrane protein